ncbi:hypothetical protein ACFFSW_26155 [Saccharothrix longispora]|uniref:Uncharacterized protein n=1 Tax=Saccharothrix longispora TaxID=33920 RepID=A0ABU1PRA6_9PSEU|nr:hypothetical protein [Saccharothrix longispora]MDR6592454.1 hypothetical protein [Saccharothrix longispora]
MPPVAEGRYVPDSSAVLGQRSGLVGSFFVYLALLFAALAGPAFAVIGFVVEDGVRAMAWTGLGVTLFMTPLAVFFWRGLAAGRKAERRVRAVGLPAAAEIVAVTRASVGEDFGVELTLRVSGTGIAPFVGRVTCLAEDDLVVGTVLRALVDPADNAFTVVGR